MTADPGMMGGTAGIRGMRVPVVVVLRMVAGGMTVQEVLHDHPDLEADDIGECLRYAAHRAHERQLQFAE
ncbi:MAG: DUF433 domain-containing protein [Phycisphaerales bacterium]